MGNFSRNTFDKLKHYVGVRLQQGVPIVDADWNELEDIRKYELEAFLRHFVGDGVPKGNDGFRIIAPVDPSFEQTLIEQYGEKPHKWEWDKILNDYPDLTQNDFYINDGWCLVQGWQVKNEGTILVSALLAALKGEGLPTTPGADRIDLVYLDVWEREVNSKEDPKIKNSLIDIETSIRLKREWTIHIVEDVNENTDISSVNTEEGHQYYALARLYRLAGSPVILPKDIVDLRRTGLATLSRELTIHDERYVTIGDNFGAAISGGPGGGAVFGTNLATHDGFDLYTPFDHKDYGGYGFAGIRARWGNIDFFTMGGDTKEGDVKTDTPPRLKIDGEGKVGIGTTEPQTKLHVVGNGDLLTLDGQETALIKFCQRPLGANPQGATIGYSFPGDPSLTLDNKEAGNVNISGKKWLALLTKEGVSISKAWGGNGRLEVEGDLHVDGNVGIGTTNPKANLVVGNDFGATISGVPRGIAVFGLNLAVREVGASGPELYTPKAHQDFGFTGLRATRGTLDFFAEVGSTGEGSPLPQAHPRLTINVDQVTVNAKLQLNGDVNWIGDHSREAIRDNRSYVTLGNLLLCWGVLSLRILGGFATDYQTDQQNFPKEFGGVPTVIVSLNDPGPYENVLKASVGAYDVTDHGFRATYKRTSPPPPNISIEVLIYWLAIGHI